MRQLLSVLITSILVTILIVLFILLMTAGFSANAQTPLSTPVLSPLLPPGYAPIATTRPLQPPPTYAPPPTMTVTPMWRQVYFVQNYTPLWSAPARAYTIPFQLIQPGTYLMVQYSGNWLVILNCSRTQQFVVPCPYEGAWVQNDGNLYKLP